jgi:hypothetical protein
MTPMLLGLTPSAMYFLTSCSTCRKIGHEVNVQIPAHKRIHISDFKGAGQSCMFTLLASFEGKLVKEP